MKSIARRRASALFCVTMCLVAVAFAPPAAHAANDLEPFARVDATAREWLAATGAPSVSIALVQNGALAYARAYGDAELAPARAATTTTRYAIDSVSKEFTAAAILVLAEKGKLSLDDPIGKYIPDLGPAASPTIRQVLSHTSGLRDYWPQDFVPPEMLRTTTTAAIIDEWVRRPLDFKPGTEWQYSNTGFVVAGAIVERVSGMGLLDFLQRNIFAPLGMERITEDDTQPLSGGDASGYTRQGLGPTRRAPKEGAGWLFGASELAMAPSELARWDISLIKRSLLQPASYSAAFERVRLKDGTRKDYGLGLDIEQVQGRMRIGHSGAGSGFLAANRLWPRERMAIIAVTNADWADPEGLVDRIAFLVLPADPYEARARAVFSQYQQGTSDRMLFTEAGNSLLTPTALADLKASLGPLGPPVLIELERESKRGGMVTRVWKILCGSKRLRAVERGYPDGKLEQFLVTQRND
jgi:CubicO group peptidase (beta-lactamase class C family)